MIDYDKLNDTFSEINDEFRKRIDMENYRPMSNEFMGYKLTPVCAFDVRMSDLQEEFHVEATRDRLVDSFNEYIWDMSAKFCEARVEFAPSSDPEYLTVCCFAHELIPNSPKLPLTVSGNGFTVSTDGPVTLVEPKNKEHFNQTSYNVGYTVFDSRSETVNAICKCGIARVDCDYHR